MEYNATRPLFKKKDFHLSYFQQHTKIWVVLSGWQNNQLLHPLWMRLTRPSAQALVAAPFVKAVRN